MKGDAKLIDECNSSRISPFYSLFQHNKIAFYHLEHVVPYYLVKLFCSKIAASASKVQWGVESIWKRGRLNGKSDHEKKSGALIKIILKHL